MTKSPEELLPKSHGFLEETTNMTGVEDMLEKNALAICASQLSAINSSPMRKPKLAHPKTGSRPISLKSRLGRVMHRLHNLENDNTPEKCINVDLGSNLYQMEDY